MANVHLYQHSGHTMHCGIYAGGRLSPPTLSSSFLDLHQYMYLYMTYACIILNQYICDKVMGSLDGSDP